MMPIPATARHRESMMSSEKTDFDKKRIIRNESVDPWILAVYSLVGANDGRWFPAKHIEQLWAMDG